MWVISGERDPATSPDGAEGVARALPRALHVVSPGQSHGSPNPVCENRLIADTDSLTFTVIPVGLLAIGALASWLPARAGHESVADGGATRRVSTMRSRQLHRPVLARWANELHSDRRALTGSRRMARLAGTQPETSAKGELTDRRAMVIVGGADVEILRSRHYVATFLTRRGFIFHGGANWTRRHRRWLEEVLREGELSAQDRIVFGEYLSLLDYKLQRRDELDRQIEDLALSPAYCDAVGRLKCFRGIETLAAMTLQTEIGDWRRFQTPPPPHGPPRARTERTLLRRASKPRADHQSR